MYTQDYVTHKTFYKIFLGFSVFVCLMEKWVKKTTFVEILPHLHPYFNMFFFFFNKNVIFLEVLGSTAAYLPLWYYKLTVFIGYDDLTTQSMVLSWSENHRIDQLGDQNSLFSLIESIQMYHHLVQK